MEDPLLLQFLTDLEVDLVVLDLLLGFYKLDFIVETYFCNIFLECGYNYERLQYISASDLDLIFSKREHLGLKSEFREKLQKWKRAQHIDVCAGDTTPTYKGKVTLLVLTNGF
ncbi:uncharacterized protein [Drosophila suzukii]|uniref:Uncharacterized protein n=1 Tax=Drosophila suzukii TaxID=28584 RepID=A0ABM4TNK6_DROSZ